MKATRLRTAVALATLLAGVGTALALRVKEFDAAGSTEVRLDQNLVFRCTSKVRLEGLSERFHIAPVGGGLAARGTHVRGVIMTDPSTGAPVTIDPDQVGAALIRKVEKTGNLGLVPVKVRYDLGASSPAAGRRQVLIDRSGRNRRVVTFVPDVPSLPDLSDAGYEPGVTYSVEVGRRARRGKGPNRFEFTVAAADHPQPFEGMDAAGPPRVIHTDPPGGSTFFHPVETIEVRFSHPLDPRTVTRENFFLSIASVAGRPLIQISTVLRQTALGTVEVEVIPEQPLPLGEFLELTVTQGVKDLAGAPLEPFVQSWLYGAHLPEADALVESFDTNSLEDTRTTTASWNGTEPGALVSAPADSTAVSLLHDTGLPLPNYGQFEADLDPHGGSIRIFVQGAREDTALPGMQPIDPDGDPERVHSTDWVLVHDSPDPSSVEPGALDRVDDYQYVRFRVEFTLPPGWSAGDPLPVVREIRIRVKSVRD